MEAVILAGGFGTRMRPLTYTRPKPLLPLLNRPLLQNILDALPKRIETVYIPVQYLRELVVDYFEEHPDPRVVLLDEPQPLGTGGALKNIEKHLGGPFLVYNGDIVASIDLDRFIDAHLAKKAKVTISLWPVENPSEFGVVQLEPDQRISRFVEKPKREDAPSNLINAGHYLLDLSVLDAMKPGKFTSLEREVYEPWARAGQALYGFRFDGYWIDCGRPESLLEAHRTVLAHTRRPTVVGDDVEIAKGAVVDGYAVGEFSLIGGGSRVERSILLPSVIVGRNATIRDSILGEGCTVEDAAVLERCVVGDHGVVQAGSRVLDQRIGLKTEDVEA